LVGAKTTGSEFADKIINVICALYLRGFIVNIVATDGASENVAGLKSLAILTAKDVFEKLDTKLSGDIPVAFRHPGENWLFVFVGGEMPHWIKRVVNSLENSSKTGHKQCLVLNGKPLGSVMIKQALEAVELGGISTLRQTKLTIDHFVKTPHSWMRVCLAAQILSASVHELLQ